MPYRELFPVCRDHVYLNNAGVAPTSTRVAARVCAWMENLVQHGVFHEESWEAVAEQTRAASAALIGAKPAEIAFVRNTSHGLGLVAEGLAWRPGDEVAVATSVEYPSNVYPWLHLASRGVVVREIAASPDGGVTPDALAAVLTPRTRLVAVSAVQYASGHTTDLAALGALCRQQGALLCVDGIQQVGAFPLDVKACGVHFLSADSHKWMLGMPGVGFLFVDESACPLLRPCLVGWKSTTHAWNFDRPIFELRADAAKLEEGTPTYALLAGLEAALAFLREVGIEAIAAHVRGLLARIAADATALGYLVTPAPAARAGILMLQDPRDREGHGESEGAPYGQLLAAACDAARVRVSLRRGLLRISPHIYNDDSDRDALVAVLRAHREARRL